VACDINAMASCDAVGFGGLVGSGRRVWPPRHGAPLRWSLAGLAVCFSAGLACGGHEDRAGAGGQSGDEGRRPAAWLGTGGVAAVPALR
jgi:hypothetical protein